MAQFSKWLSVAAAAALTLGAPVMAKPSKVDAANRADAQCLAIFTMVFAGDDSADLGDDARAGGMIALGYYIGRIEGRSPKADLTVLLQDVVKNDLADEAQMTAISDRCLTDIQSLSDRMVKAGEGVKNMQP